MPIKKILLFTLFAFCSAISYGQLTCPKLTSPMQGETNISVATSISWNAIEGAPGYILSIGTTEEGTDILNEQNVGNATSYQPPLGLPENTMIYVTITIFFYNADNVRCDSEVFSTEDVTEPPACNSPKFPKNGSINVSVNTPITWNYAPESTGYTLSLGSTPNGTDILNNQNIEGDLSFQPPTPLPDDTKIYATLIPYNENGSAPPCETYSFTTNASAVIPNCTALTTPTNGAINVPLTPFLEWVAVPDVIGYKVTIGTTPFNGNVLDHVTFTQNSTFVNGFEPNLTFFITIIPFNTAGDAIGCIQESFSTLLGCGPIANGETGEIIDLHPEINFPDSVFICKGETATIISTEDTADGFRWYRIDQDDNETLISSASEVSLNEEGAYRYEAYNTLSQGENALECSNSKLFSVISSEIATDININATPNNGSFEIQIENSGAGDYEYAIDEIEGFYQDSSIFTNIDGNTHTFYIRDKKGCGIAEIIFEPDPAPKDFPKFFTPNGDGINDYWNYTIPSNNTDSTASTVREISIFNRYGSLLLQIIPSSDGWNGDINNKPQPADDYWFKVILSTNEEIKGHFTLKR